jgi:hypothetical protein
MMEDAHDPQWDNPENGFDEEGRIELRKLISDHLQIDCSDALVGYVRGSMIAFIDSTWWMILLNDDVAGSKAIGIIELAQIVNTIGPLLQHVDRTQGLESLDGLDTTFIRREVKTPGPKSTLN